MNSALPGIPNGARRCPTPGLLSRLLPGRRQSQPLQAVWNGGVIADSDDIVVLEGNSYFLADVDEHLIAAGYMNDEPIDDDAHFAFVSWSHRVLLDTFDAEAFDAFLAEFQRGADAPEFHAGPHMGPITAAALTHPPKRRGPAAAASVRRRPGVDPRGYRMMRGVGAPSALDEGWSP